MRHATIAKLAASTLILGITTVGCKPAFEGSRPRSAAQFGSPVEQQAGKAAEAALAAVARQDLAAGVTHAETAVALVPRDAGYRTMLGDLYLKSGRFQSATQAYGDALQLNPNDPKTRLSLALTQIGLGRNAEAIALLAADDGSVAPADRGLALALAGDKDGAIRLLSAAAREIGATGRVRQNLALALALAGDWTQARTIAAQDVPADELDARLAKWAEFASPRQSYDQVASLIGVSPVADSGQPTRLALSAPMPAAVQTAFVEPTPPPVSVAESFAEPVAVAQAAPLAAPDGVATAELPPEAVPVMAAAMASVASVLPQQMARPVTRTMRAAVAAPASLQGRYVVQLGAFASADRVERAWNGAVRRLDRLADYVPASTRFAANNGTLTRLSVGGFAQRQAAVNLCNSLRRAGGTCFVRANAGDAPVRWASRMARNG